MYVIIINEVACVFISKTANFGHTYSSAGKRENNKIYLFQNREKTFIREHKFFEKSSAPIRPIIFSI